MLSYFYQKEPTEYVEFKGLRLGYHYRSFVMPEINSPNKAFTCFEYCIKDPECKASTVFQNNSYCFLYKNYAFLKEEGWTSYVKQSDYTTINVVEFQRWILDLNKKLNLNWKIAYWPNWKKLNIIQKKLINFEFEAYLIFSMFFKK